jgi:hypothetical protein
MTMQEMEPCATCGLPTAETAIKKCPNCWEVEGRLELYLRNGGDNAKAFILLKLGMPDTKEVLRRLKKFLQRERGRFDKFARELPSEFQKERARGESNVCSLALTKIDQIYKELKENG